MTIVGGIIVSNTRIKRRLSKARSAWNMLSFDRRNSTTTAVSLVHREDLRKMQTQMSTPTEIQPHTLITIACAKSQVCSMPALVMLIAGILAPPITMLLSAGSSKSDLRKDEHIADENAEAKGDRHESAFMRQLAVSPSIIITHLPRSPRVECRSGCIEVGRHRGHC